MPSLEQDRAEQRLAAQRFKAHVIAAHQNGESMASIGRRAGVSRQRVWKILQSAPPAPTPAPKSLVKLERRTP
jgi:DNA-binding phage protein